MMRFGHNPNGNVECHAYDHRPSRTTSFYRGYRRGGKHEQCLRRACVLRYAKSSCTSRAAIILGCINNGEALVFLSSDLELVYNYRDFVESNDSAANLTDPYAPPSSSIDLENRNKKCIQVYHEH